MTPGYREITVYLDHSAVDSFVGQLWKTAFIFSKRNPHSSNEKIMQMALENWQIKGDKDETMRAIMQDARQEFISEFKSFYE